MIDPFLPSSQTSKGKPCYYSMESIYYWCQVMRCLKNLGRGWRIHGVPWRLFLRPQIASEQVKNCLKLPMIKLFLGVTAVHPQLKYQKLDDKRKSHSHRSEIFFDLHRNFHGWLEGRLSCNMKHDETCVRFETANWLHFVPQIWLLRFLFHPRPPLDVIC